MRGAQQERALPPSHEARRRCADPEQPAEAGEQAAEGETQRARRSGEEPAEHRPQHRSGALAQGGNGEHRDRAKQQRARRVSPAMSGGISGKSAISISSFMKILLNPAFIALSPLSPWSCSNPSSRSVQRPPAPARRPSSAAARGSTGAGAGFGAGLACGAADRSGRAGVCCLGGVGVRAFQIPVCACGVRRCFCGWVRLRGFLARRRFHPRVRGPVSARGGAEGWARRAARFLWSGGRFRPVLRRGRRCVHDRTLLFLDGRCEYACCGRRLFPQRRSLWRGDRFCRSLPRIDFRRGPLSSLSPSRRFFLQPARSSALQRVSESRLQSQRAQPIPPAAGAIDHPPDAPRR